MQTNFTLSQLRDPTIARADDILRRCVHCGFCTATCPTYLLLGDERDSPRGRIYLIKEMFEQGQTTVPVVQHVDRCLSCLSCMSTCPSGVDYMHLVDMARVRIAKTRRRPVGERWRRYWLSRILTHRKMFRAALLAGWTARPLRALAEQVRFQSLAASLSLIPSRLPRLWGPKREHIAEGERMAKVERSEKKRVALLLGCVQETLRPEISSAAIRLLQRHGIDVVLFSEQTCCGAIDHHLGREEATLSRVRHNVDAWSHLMREGELDAILVTASGCGTMLKDYGTLLARDGGYADRAAAISALTKDISEFMAEIGLMAPVIWSNLKVAYQSPCSLQHGQGVDHQPRLLLREAGFRVLDIAENHICCGSAGTYSLLQPTLSAALRERKLAHINDVAPDLVATGNIGCLTQLKAGSTVPILHTVELLDWATGGPCLNGLKEKQKSAAPVRELIDAAAP